MQKSRTPLTLGWEAARANAVPALIIQAFMLALLIAYYTNHRVSSAFAGLAEFKRAHGLLFVIVASIIAGALIPELFLILFFQRGRPTRRNLRNLLFTVPVWGFDGTLVDLLYRSDAACHLGGLDSADGNHLFIASRAPIPAFWTRAFVLGLIADLYDQSLCRKNRSRCAARAICRRRQR